MFQAVVNDLGRSLQASGRLCEVNGRSVGGHGQWRSMADHGRSLGGHRIRDMRGIS